MFFSMNTFFASFHILASYATSKHWIIIHVNNRSMSSESLLPIPLFNNSGTYTASQVIQ
ncbi:unnamed protein product, partial [Schistosoma turkestanicum]